MTNGTTAATSQHNADKHKIVVVGGGFGGVQCVKSLKNSGAEITLVDQRNHHLFQPLLYQVATSVLPTSEIAWPIRRLCQERKDVTTLLGEVQGVDTEGKNVQLKDGSSLPYDTLVLATGARHSYFGNEAWEQNAPGLKKLEDATQIRSRILSAFEQAEKAKDARERQGYLTFAIIGAGPTGVELAGMIAELAQRVLPSEFRNIDTHQSRVMLIEAGPKILSVFPDKLSNYAVNALEKLGVEVALGRPVTHCDEECIHIGEEEVPCRTVIWAAGVRASNAAQWIGGETDRAGRAIVEADLTIPNHPEIFVIGDTASIQNPDGKPVPGIAPAAKQMGRYAAQRIQARLKGKRADARFVYKNSGNLATIGRNAAVCNFGKINLKGALAWWVWGFAHIYFLIGTRSRFAVAWSWLWSFVTGQNSARLITRAREDHW